MFYKRFVFKKPFQFGEQTLAQNTIIDVINEKIYVNNGQITPTYYHLFENIVEDYLSGNNNSLIREIPIPYNKV